MTLTVEHPKAGLNWKSYGGHGDMLLMVHGLGGSLANWNAVGTSFARHYQPLALDLPGFGMSPPREDFTLTTHARAVVEFIDEIGGPVILIANSMGGLICEMVASDRPDMVSRLVLVSPATPPRFPDDRLHWPTAMRLAVQATPGAGRILASWLRHRYTPEELVDLSLRLITHEPSRVPPAVVESLVDLAQERVNFPWAVTALTRSANSTARLYRRPRDFVRMIRRIVAPTLIVHGSSDRIVSPGAIEWLHSLRSDWDIVQMGDTGHTPQLDAPVRFFDIVDKWLAGHR